MLIIGVVAAVVVLLIAAVAASLGGNTKATDKNNGSSDNTASNSQLAMTVSRIRGHHSADMMDQAADGNIIVMAYANITNNGATSTLVSALYLTLTCSDGKNYTTSWKGDTFTALRLDHAKSTAIYCAFEIPVGVTPTSLKFDDHTDSIIVPVTSSIIDLSYPQFAEISRVTHTDPLVYSPYILPAAGNKYVQVTLILKNDLATTLTLYGSYFKLETSDGQTHDITYSVSPMMPDDMQSGASAIIQVNFEVSQSSTPTKLLYDDYVNTVTVNL
ncbi:MAG: DUF4352 domain-containing protein [Methanomassiliicoccus sp.]|nr:DUF4352 domain-containing protein [Methanomassiliicoccus sp.]